MKGITSNNQKKCLINYYLKNLDIKKPTQKQLNFIRAIVNDTGIFFSKVSFNEKLSPQESACIHWAAKGKTNQETAEIMNIKLPSVKVYHDRIKKKLKCKTLAEVIYNAIKFNIIDSFDNTS